MAALTLYPPIVDTYMPAFIVGKDGTGTCRIYFAISDYNALGGDGKDNEILHLFVSITNQYTNESIVDTDLFKSGLINLSWENLEILEDSNKTGDDKFYIEITSDWLKDKKWNTGEVYKIQIRFCNAVSIENSMSWLTANINKLSEWSTVCLIQGIVKPIVSLKNFPSGNNREVIFSVSDNHIVGNIHFDSVDNDYLNTYKIQLFEQADLNKILYDSGDIYSHTIATNQINHFIKYDLKDGVRYLLRFYYLTDKLYEETLDYKFYVLDTAGVPLNATIEAIPHNEKGSILVTIKSDYESFLGGVTIRRASSENNFTLWEDVQTLALDGTEPINIEWEDYSVKSGVWYKYCAQKRNIYGHRGVATMIKNPVMVLLDDIFLIGENNQRLKLKFNPQISGYSTVVSESSTQTIGSQYPFVKRNGNTQYKQFTISGLISHFMDDMQIFTNYEKDFSQDIVDLYKDYNDKNRITPYNDFTYERLFRDKVHDFLLDGKVKLFKSATEGNILVRLMNISFNPEVTLGRMLYSFSATAVEIDDFNMNQLDYYNIQTIGSYTEAKSYLSTKERLLNQINFKDLNSYLLNYEELIKDPNDNKKLKINKITDIAIKFNFPPYLIKVSGDSLERVTNKDIKITDEKSQQIVTGYIIKIAEGDDPKNISVKSILVGEQGYYQLNNANINNIQIIGIESNNTVDIQCKYILQEDENYDIVPNILTYYETESQDTHTYFPTENIVTEYIYDKHRVQNNLDYEKLYSINKIALEANPNSVFYLQDSSGNNYKRVIINDTGYLNLEDNDYFYTGIYALGTHLIKKERTDLENEIQEIVSDFEFIDYRFKAQASSEMFDDPFTLEDFLLSTEGEILQNHGVYKVKNLSSKDKNISYSLNELKNILKDNNYIELLDYWNTPKNGGYDVIYYNNNWYLFNDKNDMIHPFGAIINYYGEIEKGEFTKK